MENSQTLVSLFSGVTGLTYLGTIEDRELTRSTWGTIIYQSATPVCKVPADDSEESWELLVDRWREICAHQNIGVSEKSVLVSVGGYAQAGWAQIVCSDTAMLLQIGNVEPELIVINYDHFVAITCEEDEYWIFSANRVANNWILDATIIHR